jgi:hypothetical protein
MGWYVAGKFQAGRLCRICKKSIQDGDRIYFEKGEGLVHGVCLEKEVEAEEKAKREKK